MVGLDALATGGAEVHEEIDLDELDQQIDLYGATRMVDEAGTVKFQAKNLKNKLRLPLDKVEPQLLNQSDMCEEDKLGNGLDSIFAADYDTE